MIDIDRLKLQLPEGFEHRAGRISRMIGDQLALTPIQSTQRFEQLSIGPVQIGRAATDQQVARDIARAIQQQLNGGTP